MTLAFAKPTGRFALFAQRCDKFKPTIVALRAVVVII